MATARFGKRGAEVAIDLLKAPGEGLDRINGGGRVNNDFDEFTLVWEDSYDYYYEMKTTNSMATGNTLIFQYPKSGTMRNIILTNSNSRLRVLTLVLQTGTITSDTIKFLREITLRLG